MTTIRLVLLACSLLGLAGLPAHAADTASPRGKGYLAHVYGSDGQDFLACFFFARNGQLLVEHYGPVLYRFDALDDQTNAFQALNATGQVDDFWLTFHGNVGGDQGRTLTANGLSSYGTTFILQGRLDRTCKPQQPTSRSAGASPWR
ncbi:MAG: hypothetical protein AB7I59_05940 [Geminicoccaceae bacterium]